MFVCEPLRDVKPLAPFISQVVPFADAYAAKLMKPLLIGLPMDPRNDAEGHADSSRI